MIQLNARRQHDGSVPHDRLPFGDDWSLDRPNPSYFAAVADRVRAATDLGIVPALVEG